MKKSLLLGLGTIALALGGAAFGLHAANAVEAKADPTYSGSIIIQKNDDTLKSRNKLVGYLFNDTQNAWGTAVVNDANKYQTYSWSGLAFEPTKIIILNVADNWASSWDNPWWSPSCRTGDVPLASTDVVWMNNDATESNDKWGYWALDDVVVKGGASDDWSVATVDVTLPNVKTDGSKIEVYGSVSLPANTYFKILKGSKWLGAYTCLEAIGGNLSGGGASNIHNTAAATYEFYFDYEGETTYITDPVIAAADEWAQTFLAGGCSSTKTNWTTLSGTYSALSDDVKALYLGVAAGGKEDGAYYEHAVARYDLVLTRYGVYDAEKNPSGYADFMGRAAKLSLAKTAVSAMSTNNNSGAVWAVVIGSVSVAALLGAGFFFRKRRQN